MNCTDLLIWSKNDNSVANMTELYGQKTFKSCCFLCKQILYKGAILPGRLTKLDNRLKRLDCDMPEHLSSYACHCDV